MSSGYFFPLFYEYCEFGHTRASFVTKCFSPTIREVGYAFLDAAVVSLSHNREENTITTSVSCQLYNLGVS